MHRYRWLPMLLALGVGVLLRLALWDALPRQGMISDEAEYLAAADWLAQGRGVAWHQGWLWTRAPLYPLFLAAHIALFDFHLTPIFLTQTALSLLNVVLVYLLAQHALRPFGGQRWGPGLAALLAAIYLPFASYAQIVLAETLYLTLLLAGFLLLARWAEQPARRLPLLLAALLFGLATLTRGLTLGFLPLLLLWVLLVAWPLGRLRWQGPLLFGVLCALTIAPWSLYASRAYGGPVIVDTTGAFNLLLGARTAYDGSRSDAPTRNFVLALLDDSRSPAERRALLDDSCLLRQDDPRLLAALAQPPASITQAQRQQLMTAEGLCLLRATPGAFVAKSLRELADFFQINYTGAERMSGGFTQGRLPGWYALALFGLDDTLYVLLLPLAVLGYFRARAHSAAQPALRAAAALALLVGLWWLYNLLTAPLLFAINRFRLPLLPFAFIYATAALLPAQVRVPLRPLRRGLVGLLALLLALLAATPYAYLQAPPSAWASYLGPYPSSLAASRMAWEARPVYLHEQKLIAALGKGQAATARELLAAGPVRPQTARLAPPLLAGLLGIPGNGLALLPPTTVLSATRDWRAAVVRGDLHRRMEDWDAARAAFTPTFVDDQNPVSWAWRWLAPPPTRRIDLGGNLDLGYIDGFYLGEGDQSAAGAGTFRWSAGEARLRFPAQGRTAVQTACWRVDGRGWPPDLPPPTYDLLLTTRPDSADIQHVTRRTLARGVEESCALLPPVPPGADMVLVFRTPTFVPPAADLLAQQGPQASQLRLLGLRLDWVELREALP